MGGSMAMFGSQGFAQPQRGGVSAQDLATTQRSPMAGWSGGSPAAPAQPSGGMVSAQDLATTQRSPMTGWSGGWGSPLQAQNALSGQLRKPGC